VAVANRSSVFGADKSEDAADQQKQTEKRYGSGLEKYDLGGRLYDPQIGRFFSRGRLSEFMRKWNPYQYAFDHPIHFSDREGMVPTDSTFNTNTSAPVFKGLGIVPHKHHCAFEGMAIHVAEKEVAEQSKKELAEQTSEKAAKVEAAQSTVPKGFQKTQKYGRPHGQNVYKKGNRYYSKDIDAHSTTGGWKVFKRVGVRLIRIGTADKNLSQHSVILAETAWRQYKKIE